MWAEEMTLLRNPLVSGKALGDYKNMEAGFSTVASSIIRVMSASDGRLQLKEPKASKLRSFLFVQHSGGKVMVGV